MTDQTRLYAVSTGNGNDGVSHMFPDYYVRTNDPYRLATLALVSQFKPAYQAQVLDECETDGESDYTVSCVLYEPLDEDRDSDDDDDYAMSYCDANGAYMIVDVFPGDGPDVTDPWHKPIYMSIEECFAEGELALVGED